MAAPPAPDAPRPPTTRSVLLQILGLAGSSHLLEQLVRSLPGFHASELARRISGDAVGASPGSGIDPTSPYFIALVGTALGSAVVEELLFRGWIFGLLRRARGRGVAVVLSALLFGAAHLDPRHAALATLLGLQLGAIRQLYGLPLAIGAHVANNALWLLAVAVGLSGSGPVAPPMALTLLLATLLAGSACAVLAQAWRSQPGCGSAPKA